MNNVNQIIVSLLIWLGRILIFIILYILSWFLYIKVFDCGFVLGGKDWLACNESLIYATPLIFTAAIYVPVITLLKKISVKHPISISLISVFILLATIVLLN